MNYKTILPTVLTAIVCAVAMAAASVSAAPLPGATGRTNLAQGKTVQFAPKPYKGTAKGGTDSTDLTDGKLSQRQDNKLWKDQSAVTWYEAGQVNLALDLGKQCSINEVAMRFNGRSKAGVSLPPWIKVLVSNDGKHYRQAAEFSRFQKGAFEKYRIPLGKKGAWIYCFEFKNIDTTARYVGIQFYGSNLTSSDELYVFGKPASKNQAQGDTKNNSGLEINVHEIKQHGLEARATRTEQHGQDARATGAESQGQDSRATGFTVNHAEVYFHKPYLKLATNLALPVPVGMTTPDSKSMKKPVVLTLDVPKGIALESGRIRHTPVNKAKTKPLANGATQYRFTIAKPKTTKNIGNAIYGRLYFKASGWENGQRGTLHYRFSQGDWNSGRLSIPISAVTVPPAPRLKNIMASMGWWRSISNAKWPDVFQAYRAIGLNTFNMFNFYYRNDYPNGLAWKMLKKARGKGFKISMIAMPQHHQLRYLYKKEPEVYHQFKDGKTSAPWRICMSYRGQYYHKMLDFYAQSVARIQPEFSSEDIEPWYRGARSSIYERCLRCQASFKKSGFQSWDTWLIAQGNQMWKDMVIAAREKLKAENIDIDYKTGMFGATPTKPYQNVWSVRYLYPKWMDASQPAYYSPLFPQDLANLGDRVRRDRIMLGANDVMPWLTPGDAGVFPGSAFKWAILECYTNGARGVWFWSNRVWDSEDLIAYNKVIRAIAPVENVIIHGDLLGSAARVLGKGRISGMKLNGKMILLVADYLHQTDGDIKLQLNLPKNSVVLDLLNNGKQITTLKAGQQNLTVSLNGKKARFLEIKPK